MILIFFFYKSMQFGSSIPAALWPFDSEVGKKQNKTKTKTNGGCEHFVRTSFVFGFYFFFSRLKWVSCHFMLIFKCAINYISNVF